MGLILYYLGIPVEPVGMDFPNAKGRTSESFGLGRVNAIWLEEGNQEENVYTFYSSQLFETSFGGCDV